MAAEVLMDHEEAFLRAVREAPGDDTPRLVYADWLEERGDPRGDYLRAEIAWARRRVSASSAGWRRRAAGHDRVWVARVSRPPLGVCCDHVRFRKVGPPRTPAALEERLGARLPPDFRAFLLDTNGGAPDPPCIPDPRHEEHGPLCLEIGEFYRAGEGGGDGDVEGELEWMRSLYENYDEAEPFPAEGMLPFANTLHDLGCLLVGIAPGNFGRVFHFTNWARSMDDPSALAELAPSFADLLARLTPDLED
jgi:uncharacterized protein (TIGR02996 family)